jgi:hypothetical protein
MSFRITVRYGKGDRKASSISGDLIIDENMAKQRGYIELAKLLNIKKQKNLRMPHDPAMEVGDYVQFSHAALGMWGAHRVMSLEVSFSPNAVYDTVSVEQYSLLIRPDEIAGGY